MSLLDDGDNLPSRTEVRQVEARVDARFQAVNARFTTMDRRFAGVVRRVDDVEHQARSLIERFDAHSRTLAGRLDATDARIDLVHDNFVMQLDQSRREHARHLRWAVGATMAATTVLAAVMAWGWSVWFS